MDHVDVLIIGAGPIGLETAWHVRQAGLSIMHVDAGAVGQTIVSQFPPRTPFFSSPERLEICGIAISSPDQAKPTGEAYLAYLRTVVRTLDLDVATFTRAVDAVRDDDGFVVSLRTLSGHFDQVHARHVVLSTGGTNNPRRLGIPGEDLPHVSNFLGDPHRYLGRRVVIVGSRNSAVESALRCWRVGADVTLVFRAEAIHERVKYWLKPEFESLVDEGRIRACCQSVLTRIDHTTVTCSHLKAGKKRQIPADDVVLQIGFEQDAAIFDMFGVVRDGPQQAPVFNPDTLETCVPGVFVAGTATAGTQQRFSAYIETSHGHGPRIAAALTGAPPPPPYEPRVVPES